MFSENGRISKRQIRRLLIYDLFGINTLLLPVLLAKYVGKDGIFSIFGAWVLLLCYLVFLVARSFPGCLLFFILYTAYCSAPMHCIQKLH